MQGLGQSSRAANDSANGNWTYYNDDINPQVDCDNHSAHYNIN